MKNIFLRTIIFHLVIFGALFLGLLEQSCSLTQPISKEIHLQPDSGSERTLENSHLDFPPKGSIGSFCEDNQTCQEDFQCENRIPKGYCTKECIRSTECPAKSVCVRVKFEDGTQFQRCLRTCFTNRDCRPSFYCYHPPGAWKLICLPKLSKP